MGVMGMQPPGCSSSISGKTAGRHWKLKFWKNATYRFYGALSAPCRSWSQAARPILLGGIVETVAPAVAVRPSRLGGGG